jgi:hypothetical protein
MENFIAFFIISVSLFAVLDYRVAKLVNTVFWIPYFIYLKYLTYTLLGIVDIINIKSKNWEFGYLYKLCLKAFIGLIKTQEVAKIMKGIKYDEPHDYVCKCDRDKPSSDKTIFRVRFLTVHEQAHIRDMMYNVSGMGTARREKFLTGSAQVKALEYGLLGWKNFTYENGESIQFDKENFSCIPPAERDELANYIRGIEEEEGGTF